MSTGLPHTPADVLDVSPSFRFKMATTLTLAKALGFWDYPYRHAASSFEDMTALDAFYWVHKSKNPIIRAEKSERIADLLMTDRQAVAPPRGFEKRSSLTLGAAGDLLQAEGLEHSKDMLFEGIADLLFDKTVSFANLESPITEQELIREVISDRAAPIQCCSREQFNILKGHKDKRFTVINTANNHMFDMGVEGVETTLGVLSSNGILNVGTNSVRNEYGQGKILIRENIKLGFASVTFGLNGRDMPAGEDYRINVAKLLPKRGEPELDLLKRQINHCRSEDCDFVIASLHWGYEFEFFPRKRQLEIARTLVEWGADAIIGHHPHVVQPVEYIRTRRDPNRIAVIAYSLGTLTWGFVAPHLVLGAILNLTLSKGNFKGKDVTYIEKADVTPIFRNVVNCDGRIVSRLEKLADYLDGRGNGRGRDYISAIKRYADLVLGAQSPK